MFEPRVLPEEFPQTRERRTRKPLAQGTEQQDVAPAADAAAEAESQPQDELESEALPAETLEALAQALEDAQAAGEPVEAIAGAVASGEAIKAEIIGDEATGRALVITAEPENIEAAAQPESDMPAKKLAPKGKGKKGKAATVDAGK